MKDILLVRLPLFLLILPIILISNFAFDYMGVMNSEFDDYLVIHDFIALDVPKGQNYSNVILSRTPLTVVRDVELFRQLELVTQGGFHTVHIHEADGIAYENLSVDSKVLVYFIPEYDIYGNKIESGNYVWHNTYTYTAKYGFKKYKSIESNVFYISR